MLFHAIFIGFTEIEGGITSETNFQQLYIHREWLVFKTELRMQNLFQKSVSVQDRWAGIKKIGSFICHNQPSNKQLPQFSACFTVLATRRLWARILIFNMQILEPVLFFSVNLSGGERKQNGKRQGKKCP